MKEAFTLVAIKKMKEEYVLNKASKAKTGIFCHQLSSISHVSTHLVSIDLLDSKHNKFRLFIELNFNSWMLIHIKEMIN